MPLFLSAPYMVAAAVGQWSPLLTAAAILPGLQALAFIKPNLGAAAFAYKPNRTVLAVGAVLAVSSLLIMPNWLVYWLQEISDTKTSAQYHYPILAAFPLGLLLLAAGLHYRKPEGRLLLVLAVIRQKLWFYDQLQLWLIPTSLYESSLLTFLSWLAYGLWRLQTNHLPIDSPVKQPDTYILLFCFLPSLVMLYREQVRRITFRLADQWEKMTVLK